MAEREKLLSAVFFAPSVINAAFVRKSMEIYVIM